MIAKKKEMSIDDEVSLYRARIPMYHGNYCGKGNNGGKPKDRLDAACKKHDECYAKHEWGKCKCDKPFIIETQKIYRNKKYSLGYRKHCYNVETSLIT
ncbi:phospholipase A2 family protein [Mammaliicoccus lentus]|uniref:phospholipase A2 family protein n=1 Tax=Mammaliicoccus lentus TaxID=42858 RepID=UPI001B331469|nr:phospholipase A2 family protein [Mammaliicoccus lentus]